MRKLTKNEQAIVDYLSAAKRLTEDGWIPPTQIGEMVGGGMLPGYSGGLRGSSWASPICKRLVRFGLLERNDKGHYRVLCKHCRQAGGK